MCRLEKCLTGQGLCTVFARSSLKRVSVHLGSLCSECDFRRQDPKEFYLLLLFDHEQLELSVHVVKDLKFSILHWSLC